MSPDGEPIEINPLQDYFCDARPKVHEPVLPIFEKFLNWARSESLWVLGFGTGTFGGAGDFFNAWGSSDVAEATRLVDICLDAGLTLFDSADVYSAGASEEILGQAIKGRRDRVLISTKGTFRTGPGPNDLGSSRYHLIRTIEGSLRRLGTDYIDLYQLHGFDAITPMEEVLGTLDDLVRAGKLRYIGCSNFSGWHLMKALAVAEKQGLARYVAHQAYY